jgi:hypothetical protein
VVFAVLHALVVNLLLVRFLMAGSHLSIPLNLSWGLGSEEPCRGKIYR